MSTIGEILYEIESLSDSERQMLLEKLLPPAQTPMPSGAIAPTPPSAQASEATESPRKFRTWLGVSPATGLPVLMAEADAPPVTSEQVRELLADFP